MAQTLFRSVSAIIVLTGIAAMILAQPGEQPPKDGWADLFPTLTNYSRTVQPLVIVKGKSVYRQSAKYSWLGGDFREATATLARDPEFKTAHTAAALKKAGAKEIKIGKRDAWIIPGEGMKKFDKIIVPLGDDRALIVEGIGIAHKQFPVELAGGFDLDKAAAALGKSPQ